MTASPRPPLLGRALAIAALLAGCPAPEPTLVLTPAVQFDDAAAVTYAVDGGFGDLSARATVRALNSHGAAVSAADLPVRADGEQVTVKFDATGFGSVRFDVPGRHTVEAGTSIAEVQVSPELFTAPSLALAGPAGVQGAHEVAATSQGVVVRTGNEVWWAERGGVPMKVFTSPDPLWGLRTDDVDVDGATDAVVWTGTEVFLLRGRPGGGMAWGTGFRATGFSVGGVDLGDVSGDNLTDLAIAWVGGDTGGMLDVWEGDGQWSFFAAYARSVPGTPTGVAVNDTTNDDIDQVTVSTGLGDWARYVMIEHQMVPVGPLVPDGTLNLEATVVPWGDTTGDAGEELSFQVRDDFARVTEMTLFNLLGTPPLFDPTRYTWSTTGSYWSAGDADGDGYTELFHADDLNQLGVIGWDSALGYVTRIAGSLVDRGPIAVRDYDPDGILDLVVSGDRAWRTFSGDDRTSGVEDLVWGLERTNWNVATSFGGGPTLRLPAGPDTVRMLTFERTDSGATHARVIDWFGEDLPVELDELASEEISDVGADVREVVLCGDRLFVLMDGLLRRLSYNDADGSLVLQARRDGTTATGLGCGEGPSGAVVVIAEADQLISLNLGLTEVDSTPLPGAGDAALGDLGAGPVAQGCATPECSIVAFQSGFFETSSAGSAWIDAEGTHPLPGVFNWAAVDDVDGDGITEVVAATADGLVGVYRGTGDSVGGPRMYHHVAASAGMPTFADGDHDGIYDLWFSDLDRNLTFSLSAPPPAPPTTGTEPTPTDTGTPPGTTN